MALRPHHLLLEFDTGEYRVRDLSDLVDRREPLFAPLNDWDFFRRVRVDDDGVTVIWPNGLDLDPGMLYAASVPVDVGALLAGKR
jgi:hypothetical protein